MRIVKLVVSDFKSYKGDTVVHFGDNFFSCIIGPNGAGKSNLMDAISFVLGSSLAELRTKTFSDLVWRSGTGESAATSSVEVYFEDKTFARRIRQGKSEFEINGHATTRKEYLEQLEQIGIASDRNSLVFQGSIERMASLTPGELAGLFEQISGSDQFKESYDEAAANLVDKKHTATSCGRARSQHLAIVKRLNVGVEAKKKKTRLDKKINSLTDQELQLRGALLQCRLLECDKEVRHLKREKRSMAKNLVASSDEAKEVKRNLVKNVRLIQSLEDQLRSIQAEQKRASAAMLDLQSKVSDSANKLTDLEPQLSRSNLEVDMFAQDITRLESQISQTSKGFERLLDEVPTFEGDQALYEQCLQEFKMETALDQAELKKIRQSITALESDYSSFDRQLEAQTLRVKLFSQQHTLAELEARESLERIERNEQQLDAVSGEERAFTGELTTLRTTIAEMEAETRQKALTLRQLQNDKRRVDERNLLIDAVQKLKRKLGGVVGLLYTLVEPKDERFGPAIDLILGGNFNAVVVNTVQTARKCIEFASVNNLGIMTFLPLDGLVSKSISSSLRASLQGTQGARLAIDAVKFERDHAAAVQYACGDAIVCDSLDLAYETRRQHPNTKVVSNGIVLHTNGIVTAGSGDKNRFEKAKLSTLRMQLTDAVEDLKVQKLNETALTEKCFKHGILIESLRAKISQLQEQHRFVQATVEARALELNNAESYQAELQGKVAELRERIEEWEGKMEHVKTGFSEIRARIFAPFTETCNVSINAYEKALEKREKLNSDLNKQTSRLEKELDISTTKHRESSHRATNLHSQVEKYKAIVQESEPKLFTVKETLASHNSKDLQHQIAEAEAATDAFNAELNRLQGAEVDQNDATLEMDRSIARLEELAESTQQQFDLVDADTERALQLCHELETSGSVQEAIETTQTEIREAIRQREKLTSSEADSEGIEEAEATLEQLTEELTAAQAEVTTAQGVLDDIKEQRTQLFNTVYEPVHETVNVIYKELTTTSIDPLGGTAALRPMNENTPFLGGIRFTAMPPRKPFSEISSLSGGEKTIAALALIFALNTHRSSPVYVLDEVDAALDYANVDLVAKYIQKCADQGSQFVVISLKLGFYEHADNLLGVYRARNEQGSKLATYSLA